MKKYIVLSVAALVTISLYACTANEPSLPDDVVEDNTFFASSEPAQTQVMYEGTVVEQGPSMYMQGTHRLIIDGSDRVVLLSSATVHLEAYVNSRVRIQGMESDTVEGNAHLVDVAFIEMLSSSSSSSSQSLSSSSEVSSESVSSASSEVGTASSMAASSVQKSVASSSKASSRSSVAVSSKALDTQADTDPKVAAMAKAKVDSSVFTQPYCSRHVGFCTPLHKSWYYQSFGATSSYLWHVEVSSQEVEKLGDGPLVINLVSGALNDSSLEGVTEVKGDFVVGYKSWTNNRHFEITAPVALKAAVAYMASNVTVYEDTSSVNPQ